MPNQSFSLTLASEKVTKQFASRLGHLLRSKDIILLSGKIGAGKTFLARALIQSLLTEHEDVPSPTFTIVQTYKTTLGELWHCDLYRINNSEEIDELGLLDAFGSTICLVEWPDRLKALQPREALGLHLSYTRLSDTVRNLEVSWTHSRWNEARTLQQTERSHALSR
ncbi:MAG: tRNA (adenosine(37)-N6)-threonylcarbamoyltransferase complex ATPase subunit type 1 TsaE [Aestuariivita sp.]|nr:tRNA (adenosine(37)-N6)-threonylcarbamoyltransferase complex ATPase subunit type 1 TsaE [Aestuariivita sp.]MCY4203337.1 tRNA (adenosine(37)-N6)-threonylcarbamoyltransferase complex ATPase subunit type 1 TsaE [Aestuariivita sp.]MCY4287627.1 tRNA (adenosine(37)-N6)-threonylcarbamoyltransferase complex ATPase subunit type 1 TsaE [Aestuariivita sp.]MCY4346425.1 tRNA (adenosine(37)-N6)-threonylcarbamoyltransferase complex ATPase subunit type 1 TsaE [Aestuariivita sp.]